MTKSIQKGQSQRTKYENSIVPELTTIWFFLKVANVGIHFRWSGRAFHNFALFTETATWANDVLWKGMLQLTLEANLVDLVLCCLVIILQSGSGAASFKHLKTSLTRCREIKLTKLKILYLLWIWQWWYLILFLSRTFKAWL